MASLGNVVFICLTAGDYYDRTTKVITDHLLDLLNYFKDTPSVAWNQWINIWSQFPLDGFLQSTAAAVMTKVKLTVPVIDKSIRLIKSKELEKYLPRPDAAITAYSVSTYTEQLDQSLVQYLDRKSTRLNSSHTDLSRMPSSA